MLEKETRAVNIGFAMTRIGAEDIDRNWLWLGIDSSQSVAVFQSCGKGALPPAMLVSLEDAEQLDEFIEESLMRQVGYCSASFCVQNERWLWRSIFPGDEYTHVWISYMHKTTEAASCGLFIYSSTDVAEIGRGYVLVAKPSNPLKATSLPEHLQPFARRCEFANLEFEDLQIVDQSAIEKIV